MVAALSSSPLISLVAAALSRKAAGTLQQLVFRHGLELMERLCLPLGRRWQAAGWGDLDSVPSNFCWVLMVGWSDHIEWGCSTSLGVMPGCRQALSWNLPWGSPGLQNAASCSLSQPLRKKLNAQSNPLRKETKENPKVKPSPVLPQLYGKSRVKKQESQESSAWVILT